MPLQHTTEHPSSQAKHYTSGQRRFLNRCSPIHPPAERRMVARRVEPWVRPGCTRTRPDLDPAGLIDAVEWMATRCRREWTPNDASIMAELGVRAWRMHDINRARRFFDARWLEPLVPPRRKAGWGLFLRILISAVRDGAVGVWAGYHELKAVCDVASDATWRRWTKEAEQLGLIRIVQTWAPDKTGLKRQRRFDRLLYLPGPKLLEHAGAAIFEGLAVAQGDDDEPSKVAPYRRAKQLRNQVAKATRERARDLWRTKQAARPARPGHSLNCSSVAKAQTQLPVGAIATPPGGVAARSSEQSKDRPAAAALFIPARTTQVATPSETAARLPPRPSGREGAPRSERPQAQSVGDLLADYTAKLKLQVKRSRRRGSDRIAIFLFFLTALALTACSVPRVAQGEAPPKKFFFRQSLDRSALFALTGITGAGNESIPVSQRRPWNYDQPRPHRPGQRRKSTRPSVRFGQRQAARAERGKDPGPAAGAHAGQFDGVCGAHGRERSIGGHVGRPGRSFCGVGRGERGATRGYWGLAALSASTWARVGSS